MFDWGKRRALFVLIIHCIVCSRHWAHVSNAPRTLWDHTNAPWKKDWSLFPEIPSYSPLVPVFLHLLGFVPPPRRYHWRQELAAKAVLVPLAFRRISPYPWEDQFRVTNTSLDISTGEYLRRGVMFTYLIHASKPSNNLVGVTLVNKKPLPLSRVTHF